MSTFNWATVTKAGPDYRIKLGNDTQDLPYRPRALCDMSRVKVGDLVRYELAHGHVIIHGVVNGDNPPPAPPVEQLLAANGHICFPDGFMIAWRTLSANTGGTSWVGWYYSSHAMGNWTKPFTVIYATTPSSTYYSQIPKCSSWSTTSAGSVYLFGPASNVVSQSIQVVGFGRWK
ncbi:MAG: hypothetical protein FWG15_02755 [Propionibacteriaceae bacterium]|nr:hypothetical protein [Propionibacteriaceae bacterium]